MEAGKHFDKDTFHVIHKNRLPKSASKKSGIPASDNPIDTSFGMLKGKSSLLEELIKSRLEDAARGK